MRLFVIAIVIFSLFGCKSNYGTLTLNDAVFSKPNSKKARISQRYNEQVNNDCNPNKLNRIDSILVRNPKEITNEDITLTFDGLRDWCVSRTEYSEYQNEILYKLLDLRTLLFIETLDRNKLDQFQIDHLKTIIKSPINESFDLTKIKFQLEAIEESKMREMVIEALDVAIKKY